MGMGMGQRRPRGAPSARSGSHLPQKNLGEVELRTCFEGFGARGELYGARSAGAPPPGPLPPQTARGEGENFVDDAEFRRSEESAPPTRRPASVRRPSPARAPNPTKHTTPRVMSTPSPTQFVGEGASLSERVRAHA